MNNFYELADIVKEDIENLYGTPMFISIIEIHLEDLDFVEALNGGATEKTKAFRIFLNDLMGKIKKWEV